MARANSAMGEGRKALPGYSIPAKFASGKLGGGGIVACFCSPQWLQPEKDRVHRRHPPLLTVYHCNLQPSNAIVIQQKNVCRWHGWYIQPKSEAALWRCQCMTCSSSLILMLEAHKVTIPYLRYEIWWPRLIHPTMAGTALCDALNEKQYAGQLFVQQAASCACSFQAHLVAVGLFQINCLHCH